MLLHLLPFVTLQNEGRLEASSEALTWVARAGDKNVKLPLSAAKAVSFYDMGRACQLWLTDQKGVMHRFDGFRLADYDRLASFFSGVGLTLAKRELSAKGRNWGSMRINGAQLELLDDSGKLVAPIPLNAVSQAALPGKGEVEIQFFDDDAGGCTHGGPNEQGNRVGGQQVCGGRCRASKGYSFRLVLRPCHKPAPSPHPRLLSSLSLSLSLYPQSSARTRR